MKISDFNQLKVLETIFKIGRVILVHLASGVWVSVNILAN
jgi:hypothetical protein